MKTLNSITRPYSKKEKKSETKTTTTNNKTAEIIWLVPNDTGENNRTPMFPFLL